MCASIRRYRLQLAGAKLFSTSYPAPKGPFQSPDCVLPDVAALRRVAGTGQNRGMNYACAATIGAVSGLRSMTGPAIIATAARARDLKLDGTALAWFGSPKAAPVVTALAVGEMIADKLPFMPDRTRPGSLAGRATMGAICGYAVFSPRGRREGVM